MKRLSNSGWYHLVLRHIFCWIILECTITETVPSTLGKKYDAVLFDVDSKDPTLGMSCPPKEFLESDALNTVAKLIGKQGMLKT